MTWISNFYATTIGKKAVMAVTGLVLCGFLLVHMLGNLQVFLGSEELNAYAELLKSNKEILWGARLTLLACILLHIASAVALVQRNAAARPVGYKQHTTSAATVAARTMRISGPIVMLFIIYHLLHFTAGVLHAEFSATDVFGNVVSKTSGFGNPIVAIGYVVAMIALAPHLRHGVWSMFRTLGVSNPRFDMLAQQGATAYTAVVIGGNILIPTLVYLGMAPTSGAGH